jgi:hypothetical protein
MHRSLAEIIYWYYTLDYVLVVLILVPFVVAVSALVSGVTYVTQKIPEHDNGIYFTVCALVTVVVMLILPVFLPWFILAIIVAPMFALMAKIGQRLARAALRLKIVQEALGKENA